MSCHDQTEVSPTKKNTAQKIQVTSLSQEPQLERVLDAAGFLSSGLSGRTNGSGLEIDVEHIIKLLQADSVYSSYAFGIDQNTSSSGFSNLIIEEFEQGYLGFIVSYEPSTIFTGMPSFTGKVKRNTLDGRLISEMEFENGEFIQFRPTADRNGKVLLVGQCLADVEVTTECTPSKTTSTATGLPNEHIQDCVTVTTCYYEYCDIPDPWGNYIIGGLGSGPIGSGNTGGIPTSGGSNTTGTPTYSDDVNAGNNIVPILNPSKPKNIPVKEPLADISEREAEVSDSVYNHIQNPCLRNMVTKAVCENLDNSISHMINQVFENSEFVDLSFYESTTLPASTLGTTEVGNSSYGEIDRYSADVYLNVNVLPSASQELIVVTIIHEVLHGYLDYTRSSELFNDHEEMASDCVQRMAIALKNLFPNLSNSDAEALAWGGLEETQAWETMLVDEPVKANAILKLNQNHAKGRAGTKCQ